MVEKRKSMKGRFIALRRKEYRDDNYRKENMDNYIKTAQNNVKKPLKIVLKTYPCMFINTREADDRLCELLKDDRFLYDGIRRWSEIHRSFRIRIITNVMIEDLGYEIWSGKTRKVLYKPN